MTERAASITWPRYVFIAGCVLIILFVALKTPYDPDMGWHLQNGHYLLSHNLRVPATDIYSYTMSNYPLIMHEWITDILMYLIFTVAGFWGLSVFFALISAAAFILAAKSVPARPEYQMIASLIGALASYTIVGIRPQVITLFFLALVIYLLQRFSADNKAKSIYWLPLIFLVWANLHGGFAIGLFALGLYLLAELMKVFFQRLYQGFKEKKYYFKLILPVSWFRVLWLSLLSAAATLINPYAWKIYKELIATITDSQLRYNIAEWFPVSLRSSQSYLFIAYVALIVLLGILTYRKLRFTQVFMFLVFVYIGFSSWRNMPFFIIFSIPLWVMFARGLVGETLLRLASSKLVIALILLAALITGYQQVSIVKKSNSSIVAMSQYSEYQYPYNAVQYLKAHPPTGQMFNIYNWGGYLIWQLPEYKVFIDGRMPSWKYQGQYVMQDFQDVATVQSNWRDVLTRYDVGWALLDCHWALATVLKSEGWQSVYEDEMAVVLTRP